MPHHIAASRFGPHLFGPGVTLATYYDEVSGGRFAVTGDVQGWFALPHNELYYSNGVGGVGTYPNNGQRLAEDAVTAAIAGGVNLANYDANGDNIVDALLVIHSGEGYEWAGTTGPQALSPLPDPDSINSHKWVVVDGDFGPGLPRVADYVTTPELQRARPSMFPAWADSIATIGVPCHELGHVLGLPDVYDVQTSESRLGTWEIMDSGTWTYLPSDPTISLPGALPVHFSAWSRCSSAGPRRPSSRRRWVKWSSDTTVTSASTGGAPPQLLATPAASTDAERPGTGQYSRPRCARGRASTADCPARDCPSIAVDELRADNVASKYADHAGLLLLAPQDNRLSSQDDDADPWPATQTTFGPDSAPSSDLHDGAPSGVTLSAMSTLPGGSVSLTADVVNLSTGVALPFARPNPWDASLGEDVLLVVNLASAAPAATVSIFDLMGRLVRTLDTSAEFASTGRIARWDGIADDGTKVPAGMYFFRAQGGASGTGRFILLH